MKYLLYLNLSRITKLRIDKYDIAALQKLYGIHLHRSRFSFGASSLWPLLLLTETNKVFKYKSDAQGLSVIKEALISEAIIIPELNDVIQVAEILDRYIVDITSFALTIHVNVYIRVGDIENLQNSDYKVFHGLNNICHMRTGDIFALFLTNDGFVYVVGLNHLTKWILKIIKIH